MALSAPPSERKRVKVYELRENDWFDRGTGFCSTQCILVRDTYPHCVLQEHFRSRPGDRDRLMLTRGCFQEKGHIFVESEEDPERILLESRIKKEDSYQKQQGTTCSCVQYLSTLTNHAETLIVWTDNNGVDMALSFQEAEGCGLVWFV